MVNVCKLRGLIVENGLTQEKVAKEIGLSKKTFYTKMKTGIFKSDEMESMIKILKIENPCEIFFAQ